MRKEGKREGRNREYRTRGRKWDVKRNRKWENYLYILSMYILYSKYREWREGE